MDIGHALAIFSDINNDKWDLEEKAWAIRKVVHMATHNGVKKDWMLGVIQYLWDLCFEWKGDKDDE